jgi:hypothetical protein
MNRQFNRCVDPDANLVALDSDYLNDDLVTDDDLLISLPS